MKNLILHTALLIALSSSIIASETPLNKLSPATVAILEYIFDLQNKQVGSKEYVVDNRDGNKAHAEFFVIKKANGSYFIHGFLQDRAPWTNWWNGTSEVVKNANIIHEEFRKQESWFDTVIYPRNVHADSLTNFRQDKIVDGKSRMDKESGHMYHNFTIQSTVEIPHLPEHVFAECHQAWERKSSQTLSGVKKDDPQAKPAG